jgi:hypothetical protein
MFEHIEWAEYGYAKRNNVWQYTYRHHLVCGYMAKIVDSLAGFSLEALAKGMIF